MYLDFSGFCRCGYFKTQNSNRVSTSGAGFQVGILSLRQQFKQGLIDIIIPVSLFCLYKQFILSQFIQIIEGFEPRNSRIKSNALCIDNLIFFTKKNLNG